MPVRTLAGHHPNFIPFTVLSCKKQSVKDRRRIKKRAERIAYRDNSYNIIQTVMVDSELSSSKYALRRNNTNGGDVGGRLDDDKDETAVTAGRY